MTGDTFSILQQAAHWCGLVLHDTECWEGRIAMEIRIHGHPIHSWQRLYKVTGFGFNGREPHSNWSFMASPMPVTPIDWGLWHVYCYTMGWCNGMLKEIGFTDLPWFTTFTRFSFNQSRNNKWSEPHHTTWDRFLYRQELGVFRSSGATVPRLAQSPNWLQPAGRRHKLPFRPGNLAKSSWCDDTLQTCR